MQFPEGLDYSKFQHNSRNHSRLPCLLCHRRDSNAPVPKRPGASQHLPCAGCHAQQFQNSESPICTICHTDVKSGAIKLFPSRLMSFRMNFDHAKHRCDGQRQLRTSSSRARRRRHDDTGRFQRSHHLFRLSHAARQPNGRDISSCGTCHQLGGYSNADSTCRRSGSASVTPGTIQRPTATTVIRSAPACRNGDKSPRPNL